MEPAKGCGVGTSCLHPKAAHLRTQARRDVAALQVNRTSCEDEIRWENNLLCRKCLPISEYLPRLLSKFLQLRCIIINRKRTC